MGTPDPDSGPSGSHYSITPLLHTRQRTRFRSRYGVDGGIHGFENQERGVVGENVVRVFEHRVEEPVDDVIGGYRVRRPGGRLEVRGNALDLEMSSLAARIRDAVGVDLGQRAG